MCFIKRWRAVAELCFIWHQGYKSPKSKKKLLPPQLWLHIKEIYYRYHYQYSIILLLLLWMTRFNETISADSQQCQWCLRSQSDWSRHQVNAAMLSWFAVISNGSSRWNDPATVHIQPLQLARFSQLQKSPPFPMPRAAYFKTDAFIRHKLLSFIITTIHSIALYPRHSGRACINTNNHPLTIFDRICNTDHFLHLWQSVTSFIFSCHQPELSLTPYFSTGLTPSTL